MSANVALDDLMSPAGWQHIETAVRAYRAEHMAHDTPAAVELDNFSNKIAAALQHYVADRKAASEDSWLEQ